MGQNFLPCDREQVLLMPPSLTEWLPEDHFAWFVLAAVKEMDLTAFYAAYDIREVLHRRTDLSTFVVHLTRDQDDGRKARQVLDSIINDGYPRAVSPMGWAAGYVSKEAAINSQRVVCFSETPLEHIYWLVAGIEGRQVQMQPYGVALPKLLARKLSINPIWYVDMTDSGHDWAIAKAITQLRDEAVAREDFHELPPAKRLPFFQPMFTWRKRGQMHGVVVGTRVAPRRRSRAPAPRRHLALPRG